MQLPPGRPPVVPAGYCFNPTAEELIRCYLDPWVLTGAVAYPGVVCVADVYAEPPDSLTSRFSHWAHDGGCSWYFLSVARWKTAAKPGAARRMSRVVGGGGGWHNSTSRKPVVVDGGVVVGYRQSFQYRAPGNRKTAWIMDEFATACVVSGADDDAVKVLCKVHVSPRAAEPPDQPYDDDDDDDVVGVEEDVETSNAVVVGVEEEGTSNAVVVVGYNDDNNIVGYNDDDKLPLQQLPGEYECRDAGYDRSYYIPTTTTSSHDHVGRHGWLSAAADEAEARLGETNNEDDQQVVQQNKRARRRRRRADDDGEQHSSTLATYYSPSTSAKALLPQQAEYHYHANTTAPRHQPSSFPTTTMEPGGAMDNVVVDSGVGGAGTVDGEPAAEVPVADDGAWMMEGLLPPMDYGGVDAVGLDNESWGNIDLEYFSLAATDDDGGAQAEEGTAGAGAGRPSPAAT